MYWHFNDRTAEVGYNRWVTVVQRDGLHYRSTFVGRKRIRFVERLGLQRQLSAVAQVERLLSSRRSKTKLICVLLFRWHAVSRLNISADLSWNGSDNHRRRDCSFVVTSRTVSRFVERTSIADKYPSTSARRTLLHLRCHDSWESYNFRRAHRQARLVVFRHDVARVVVLPWASVRLGPSVELRGLTIKQPLSHDDQHLVRDWQRGIHFAYAVDTGHLLFDKQACQCRSSTSLSGVVDIVLKSLNAFSQKKDFQFNYNILVRPSSVAITICIKRRSLSVYLSMDLQ